MESELETLAIESLQNGYCFDEESRLYRCTTCGKTFEEGEVFSYEGRFYQAARAAELHAGEHGDRLEALLGEDPKYVGLTQNQMALFRLLRDGASDGEIAQKTHVSASTVRHQRFVFRERAKQAKLYLAMYGLLPKRSRPAKEQLTVPHPGARMVDDRYFVTEEEREETLKSAFECLVPLRLARFPAKEKKKLIVLTRIAKEFEDKRLYSEPELNEILKAIFHDFATIRRYLIEYGFLSRTPDCREYWKEGNPLKGEQNHGR